MTDETTAVTVYCERCGEKIGPTTVYAGGNRYCPRCAQDYKESERDA
jgi:formylmethanofuran dehydrogenase subunit E